MSKRLLFGAVAACLAFFVGIAWAQNVLNYKEQGGARWVIGGSLDVASGGDLDIESGASIKIAGTALSSSAAQLNKMTTVTATAADLNQTASQVRSRTYTAHDVTPDGTQCAAAGSVAWATNGSGAAGILCADNDAGFVEGVFVTPDSWDAGTVTFEVTLIQTGATTDAWEMDFEAICTGTGEDAVAYDASDEEPVQITLVADDDVLQDTTDAVTPIGTCVAGDVLAWRGAMDATASGGTLTAEIVAIKMEYTSLVGD